MSETNKKMDLDQICFRDFRLAKKKKKFGEKKIYEISLVGETQMTSNRTGSSQQSKIWTVVVRDS